MSRVVYFEIAAGDPARIQSFYQETFGWKFSRWDGPFPYWMIVTGEEPTAAINGGLMPRQHPGAGVVNFIDVPSADAMIEKIQQSGGVITQPKMAVPGVGWVAYAQDPEGNAFGIMQPDAQAS